MKKKPIVATNVGMLGSNDMKTAIVNPQIIPTCIMVSDLTFVLKQNCMLPALSLNSVSNQLES